MGKTRLIAILLTVSLIQAQWLVPAKASPMLPEVLLPRVSWDRQTNSIEVSWVEFPGAGDVKGYKVYADFLGGKLIGEVGKGVAYFAYKLERSWIGLPLECTIRTVGIGESKGVKASCTPTAAFVSIDGIGMERVLNAGLNHVLTVARNRYAKDRIRLELEAVGKDVSSRFTAFLDESQTEVIYIPPEINGKLTCKAFLGEKGSVVIGSAQCLVMTSNPEAMLELDGLSSGRSVFRGDKLRISWKSANLPKGGRFRCKIRNTLDGEVLHDLEIPQDSSFVDWPVPRLMRWDSVMVDLHYSHVVSYIPKGGMAIVAIDRKAIERPSRPIVSLAPDPKRNLIEMNISASNDGSGPVGAVEATVRGSDGSARIYRLIPDYIQGMDPLSIRQFIHHVRIGVTYSVTAVSIADDAESLPSDPIELTIPKDWPQVYIENLKPGDSIAVGSRLRLRWSVSGFAGYLGADSLVIKTPEREYNLDYFETRAYSKELTVLLDGLPETGEAKLWLKVVSEPNRLGMFETLFECVDDLRLVAPEPFGVKASFADGKATLSWDPVKGAESYIVRKRGYFERFMRLANLRDKTSIEDEQLSPDSLYDYQIEARSPTNEVISRGDAAIHTPPKAIEPAISKGRTYVSMVWPRARWVEGYNVFRHDRSQWLPVNPDTLTVPEYLDSGLDPGVEYCYRIEAVMDNGRVVGTSGKFCATTDLDRLEVKSEADSQTVRLVWSPGAEVYQYRVYKKVEGIFSKIAGDIKGGTFTDRNLAPKSTHVYLVEGTNFGGTVIERSEEIVAETLAVEEATIAAKAYSDRIKLLWPRIEGVARLEVFRDGQSLKLIPPNQAEFLDFGLKPKTRYCYTLEARNRNSSLVAVGKICVETLGKSTSVTFFANSRRWLIDGIEQEPMNAAPEISNGRLFLVVRYLTNAAGAGLSWDAKTKTVEILRKDGFWLKLQVGNPMANVNGTQTPIDKDSKIAPYIRNGLVLCPFRFIAGNLGAENDNIRWNQDTKSVEIVF